MATKRLLTFSPRKLLSFLVFTICYHHNLSACINAADSRVNVAQPKNCIPDTRSIYQARQNTDPAKYYYISPRLWYLPLVFCFYFLFYTEFLIIQGMVRHKVTLPKPNVTSVPAASSSSRASRQLDLLAARVAGALDSYRRREGYSDSYK